MVRMIRIATFVAVLCITAASTATALAQVPPGVSYLPDKHPNAIVTFVRIQDFKSATYIEAQKRMGFDPLGMSGQNGKRKSIEVALPMPAIQKIQLPDDEYPLVKVEFSPVMRQTYVLNGGDEFVLDAFRFPKVPIPLNLMTGVLNNAAFTPGGKNWKPRFGAAITPERMMVRGVAALLFDDNKEFVIFWREGTECYVVKSKAPRSELIRIIDDLL